MERLLDGIQRFKRDVFPARKHLFKQLAESQSPEVLFITCADSRIVPDMILQTQPGDLFICRNAGNIVPPYGENQGGGIAATIDYAVSILNVKHVIVCGHSDCGAMKALLTPEKLEGVPSVKRWLAHGEIAHRVVSENYDHLSQAEFVQALIEENVVAQLDHLRTFPSVAARLANGRIQLHGWTYNIATGDVRAWDSEASHYVPIEEYKLNTTAPRRRTLVAAD
jgi:carbonic anhydrase